MVVHISSILTTLISLSTAQLLKLLKSTLEGGQIDGSTPSVHFNIFDELYIIHLHSIGTTTTGYIFASPAAIFSRDSRAAHRNAHRTLLRLRRSSAFESLGTCRRTSPLGDCSFGFALSMYVAAKCYFSRRCSAAAAADITTQAQSREIKNVQEGVPTKKLVTGWGQN